jgi:hypothetical protein
MLFWMITRTTITAAWILLFGVSAAWSQDSDLGLLGGAYLPKGQATAVANTLIASGSAAASFQINYAHPLQQGTNLHFEIPLVVVLRNSGAAALGPGGLGSIGSSGPDLFLTPGIRVKLLPRSPSRASLYASAGFGFASLGGTPVFVAPASVGTGNRQNSPAAGFGGAIDERISRLVSFRGDVRDFVTKAGLGGVTCRNHVTFQPGIAFHF